jgi:hypothetical protein
MAEKSLFKRLGAFLGMGVERPRSPAKTTNEGVPGTPITGGFINLNEKNAKMRGTERYRTFDETKANVAVVGTGIRNCLTLFEGITWMIVPDPDMPGFDDEGVEDVIKEVKYDLATMRVDLATVARRQALAKFDGFAIQVWTAEEKPDGKDGIGRVQVRPPGTIDKWVREPYTNDLLGVFQRDPGTGQSHWIERERMIYSVDDQLTDVECGMGLMRHAVTDARVMGVYENQEGIGYQTDMQGIPIGRAPLGELRSLFKGGHITEDEYNARKNVLRSILDNHVKTGNLSVLFDSATYTNPDGSPSNVLKYDVELIRGDQGSKYDAIDRAIERRELRIARLFGIEHLFIGSKGNSGGYGQSKDRSKSYGQMVNSLAIKIARDLMRDLIRPILLLRGLDPYAPIKVMPDATNLRDAVEMIDGLWKLSQTGPGGVVTVDDPVVNYARGLLGAPPTPKLDDETKLSLMQAGGAAPAPEPPVDPNKIDPATGKPYKDSNPKPAAKGAPIKKFLGSAPAVPIESTDPDAAVAVSGVQVGVFVTAAPGSPGLPAEGWIPVVEQD